MSISAFPAHRAGRSSFDSEDPAFSWAHGRLGGEGVAVLVLHRASDPMMSRQPKPRPATRLITCVLSVLLVGCSMAASLATRPISESELETFLAELTRSAKNDPLADTCRLFARSPQLCETSRAGSTDARPGAAPVIECHRWDSRDEGLWVIVSGRDSAGDQYTSQLFVVRQDGKLVAQMPTYWHGVWTESANRDGTEGSAVNDAGEGSRECDAPRERTAPSTNATERIQQSALDVTEMGADGGSK